MLVDLLKYLSCHLIIACSIAEGCACQNLLVVVLFSVLCVLLSLLMFSGFSCFIVPVFPVVVIHSSSASFSSCSSVLPHPLRPVPCLVSSAGIALPQYPVSLFPLTRWCVIGFPTTVRSHSLNVLTCKGDLYLPVISCV